MELSFTPFSLPQISQNANHQKLSPRGSFRVLLPEVIINIIVRCPKTNFAALSKSFRDLTNNEKSHALFLSHLYARLGPMFQEKILSLYENMSAKEKVTALIQEQIEEVKMHREGEKFLEEINKKHPVRLLNAERIIEIEHWLTDLNLIILATSKCASNINYNKFSIFEASRQTDSIRILAEKIREKLNKKDFTDSITMIEFNRGTLTRIPQEIVQFTQLQKLYLSSHRISYLPSALANLKHLIEFDCGGNRIRKIPRIFGRLENLQFLNVGGNQITSIPGDLADLKNLLIFYARNNRIEVFPKELICLPKLKSLILDGNRIKEIPSELTQINLELISVLLSGNQIKTIPLAFTRLPDHCNIDLSDNSIDVTTLHSSILSSTNPSLVKVIQSLNINSIKRL